MYAQRSNFIYFLKRVIGWKYFTKEKTIFKILSEMICRIIKVSKRCVKYVRPIIVSKHFSMYMVEVKIFFRQDFLILPCFEIIISTSVQLLKYNLSMLLFLPHKESVKKLNNYC